MSICYPFKTPSIKILLCCVRGSHDNFVCDKGAKYEEDANVLGYCLKLNKDESPYNWCNSNSNYHFQCSDYWRCKRYQIKCACNKYLSKCQTRWWPFYSLF